jgi:hypothetical protein
MLINIGIILSICNDTLEDCSYKNISLPGTIDINILLPTSLSFTSSTESIFSSLGISVVSTTEITKDAVAITTTTEKVVVLTTPSQTEQFVSITKTTDDIVGSTEPVVSSSQNINTNSNNIPLILTGTTLGSLFGVAGVIILMKRRQRPPPTAPIFQEPPLVMPRVQRAYQNT